MKNKLNYYNKKGAMFGLDARIAILIMAILGLLIYPTLTHVINKTKVEAIITNMKMVDLAIEEYIDDVKSVPNTLSNLYRTLPTKAAQQTRWNGPYLLGEEGGYLMPTSITWTQVSSNCTSTSSSVSDRMCTYKLSYRFCDITKRVHNELSTYFSANVNTNVTVSYNSGTSCMDINYGNAENGAYKTFNTYKVQEAP